MPSDLQLESRLRNLHFGAEQAERAGDFLESQVSCLPLNSDPPPPVRVEVEMSVRLVSRTQITRGIIDRAALYSASLGLRACHHDASVPKEAITPLCHPSCACHRCTPHPCSHPAHAVHAAQDRWLELHGFLVAAAAADSAAAWHVAPLLDTCEQRLQALPPELQAARCTHTLALAHAARDTSAMYATP